MNTSNTATQQISPWIFDGPKWEQPPEPVYDWKIYTSEPDFQLVQDIIAAAKYDKYYTVVVSNEVPSGYMRTVDTLTTGLFVETKIPQVAKPAESKNFDDFLVDLLTKS